MSIETTISEQLQLRLVASYASIERRKAFARKRKYYTRLRDAAATAIAQKRFHQASKYIYKLEEPLGSTVIPWDGIRSFVNWPTAAVVEYQRWISPIQLESTVGRHCSLCDTFMRTDIGFIASRAFCQRVGLGPVENYLTFLCERRHGAWSLAAYVFENAFYEGRPCDADATPAQQAAYRAVRNEFLVYYTRYL